MNKIKKYIPNILTISRLVVTPLVIYLGIENKIVPLIIIAAFIAFTDFLDGRLARLWNVTSSLGAKLDTIGDKALAIGLLVTLVVDNNMFFYILILEGLIAIFNIYVFIKQRVVESLFTGKIKTWVIFITIILGLFNILFPNIKILVNISIALTVIFQLVSLFSYISVYKNRKNEKKN